MDDVPFRERNEKQETSRSDSSEIKFTEKSESDKASALGVTERGTLPLDAVCGEMLFHACALDRNLDAKRTMASELIEMGFSEAQACRILHISRRELGRQRDAGSSSRPGRREKSR
jgi:hypothetical protein